MGSSFSHHCLRECSAPPPPPPSWRQSKPHYWEFQRVKDHSIRQIKRFRSICFLLCYVGGKVELLKRKLYYFTESYVNEDFSIVYIHGQSTCKARIVSQQQTISEKSDTISIFQRNVVLNSRVAVGLYYYKRKKWWIQ